MRTEDKKIYFDTFTSTGKLLAVTLADLHLASERSHFVKFVLVGAQPQFIRR